MTNQQSASGTGLDRRRWVGNILTVCGTGVIILTGGVYLKLTRPRPAAEGFGFFDLEAANLMDLLIEDAKNTASLSVNKALILRDIDQHLTGLPPGSKLEMARLFRLLDLYPVRVLAGIQREGVKSLEHPSLFLDRLRRSNLAHLRIAYRFLISILQLHIYKYSEAWPEGYVGLPQHVQAVRETYA